MTLDNVYPAMGMSARQIVALTLPTFDDVPRKLALPSPHFVCLLCCDARDVSDRAVMDAAAVLLEQGLVYLCIWGPDCNRVRYLFDTAALIRHSRVSVRSVHLYDDLDIALNYALNVASPTIEYAETCQSSLVLTIGRIDWDQHIHQYLDEMCGLNTMDGGSVYTLNS